MHVHMSRLKVSLFYKGSAGQIKMVLKSLWATENSPSPNKACDLQGTLLPHKSLHNEKANRSIQHLNYRAETFFEFIIYSRAETFESSGILLLFLLLFLTYL